MKRLRVVLDRLDSVAAKIGDGLSNPEVLAQTRQSGPHVASIWRAKPNDQTIIDGVEEFPLARSFCGFAPLYQVFRRNDQ